MSASASGQDRSFYWRKLHSLSGIIPVGAFLAEHFWSNSYAMVSPQKYNDASIELQTIPFRVIVEAVVIWIPILFHGIYGLYVWWKGKWEASQYPWVGNWMYGVQRWTGIIAFAFIGWHVYTERFVTHGISRYTDVREALSDPLYFAFYAVGIVCASVHLGNGIWNFLCKWGLAATARSQRAAGYLGTAIAIAFSVVGLAIVICIRYQWFPFSQYLGKS